MRDDPAGHYATLGVDPDASAEAVTGAFRAAARRFHPDVPVTGDVEAFIRVKAAYDVLSDESRRAAYDRSARVVQPRPAPSVRDTMAAAWRRPSGVWLGLCAGCAGLAVFALAIGFAQLDPTAPPTPMVVPGKPDGLAPPPRPYPPAPSQLEGVAAAYVLPAGGPAILWRLGPEGDRYVPVGELAPFTAVAIRGVVTQHGMAEIGAPAAGFVYANRLTPGDAAAAERARCIYEAGAPPTNNEILARQGGLGPLRVQVENRRDQPAVVKLRNEAGVAAASVFVAPRAAVSVDWLPSGFYRPEFAFGELWSHACRRFVAGMRAQHFAAFQQLDGTHAPETRYTIPPADAIDEPDDEFNRD